MSRRTACECGVCGTVFAVDAEFILDLCALCEAAMCLDATVEDPEQECDNHVAAAVCRADHNKWRVLA